MDTAPKPGRRFHWRPLLRSLHRDAGYLAVGFTVIYALSGLAVNHIADWDPNFRSYRAVHQVTTPLPANEQAAATVVLEQIGSRGPAREVYRAAPDQLEVKTDRGQLHVNPMTGRQGPIICASCLQKSLEKWDFRGSFTSRNCQDFQRECTQSVAGGRAAQDRVCRPGELSR